MEIKIVALHNAEKYFLVGEILCIENSEDLFYRDLYSEIGIKFCNIPYYEMNILSLQKEGEEGKEFVDLRFPLLPSEPVSSFELAIEFLCLASLQFVFEDAYGILIKDIFPLFFEDAQDIVFKDIPPLKEYDREDTFSFLSDYCAIKIVSFEEI